MDLTDMACHNIWSLLKKWLLDDRWLIVGTDADAGFYFFLSLQVYLLLQQQRAKWGCRYISDPCKNMEKKVYKLYFFRQNWLKKWNETKTYITRNINDRKKSSSHKNIYKFLGHEIVLLNEQKIFIHRWRCSRFHNYVKYSFLHQKC